MILCVLVTWLVSHRRLVMDQLAHVNGFGIAPQPDEGIAGAATQAMRLLM